MSQSKKNHGSLEVICGSMFSGKSEELIRRLKRAEFAKQNIIVFKHSLDKRTLVEHVASHNGSKIKAIPTDNPQTILELTPDDADVVGIDELQFFQTGIIHTVATLVDRGKRVVVAGLDLDFRRVPFGCMPSILAMADSVLKLKAICVGCLNDAHFSQRLVNNKPAKFSDPIVLAGAQEAYQARCRSCHMIDQLPTFDYEQKSC